MLRRSFLVSAALLAVAACKRERTATVDPPVVTDGAKDLLLTWIDERGEFHVEQKVSDVPAHAREVVRVVDMAKEAPDEDSIFVVDLRSPGADGKYPVRVMKRAEFDALAGARRVDSGMGLLAAGPAQSAPPKTGPAVIIYGASWCGPCHQAAAHLKRKGIDFVEKDIEADSSANREMLAKLAKAGRTGHQIPVLDVRGKILIGFSAEALDSALAAN